MGVFPKALQNQTVARNSWAPFDVIFCMFQYGNRVAKPVVPLTKVKIFRCCLQKMMTWCRVLGRCYFGRNLQILVVLFKVLSKYILFKRRVRRIALLVVMET